MSPLAVVVRILSVEPFGDNLSVVTPSAGEPIIANRREDGSFRWSVAQVAAYLYLNAVAPQALLEARGYWAPGSKKGLLGSNKGNRVSQRMFGPEDDRRPSRGLLLR